MDQNNNFDKIDEELSRNMSDVFTPETLAWHLLVSDNIKNVDFTQEINIATGPTYFRKNIIIGSSVTVLPTKYIYPIPYGKKVTKESLKSFDLSQSYAIHHWDKNW